MNETRLDYEPGRDGVARFWLIAPEGMPCVLQSGFFDRLDKAVAAFQADDSQTGGILMSARDGVFADGADIREIAGLMERGDGARALRDWSARASRSLRQLELCGKPLVAAVNGRALGGGLELALACHRRILLARPGHDVGLPEATLGLLPGGGGTQRLPRMIGIEAALPLLLEGRRLSPEEALRQGLVDELAANAEGLLAQARRWLADAPDAVKPWDRKGFRVPGGAGPLSPSAPVSFLAGTARVKARQSRYPAGRAILSCVFEGTIVPMDKGLEIESIQFGQLAAGAVARNLVRGFMRRSALRKPRPDGASTGLRVGRLGVVGAGMMGRGIANHAASRGMEVRLIDRDPQGTAAAIEAIAGDRAREVEKGRLCERTAASILARISPAATMDALADCDLVVEAAFENLQLKQDIIADAARVAGAGALLASNTSTLSIEAIAGASDRADRVLGLHFFSPVERMPLVEIVRAKETSAAAVADAIAFVLQLDKIPIVVSDSPGFYTSRVFCTYIDEAMAMLAEGIAPALIENAARNWGLPASPLAVADEVSLDLQVHVIEQARQRGLPDRLLRGHAWPVIERMVALGRLGRKSRAGFYDYGGEGKRLWPELARLWPALPQQPDADEVARRLLYVQSVETLRCLAEGVVPDAVSADVGAVLGIGFPAWTGGTISLIETVGADAFARECAALADRHGTRFSLDGLEETMSRVVPGATPSQATREKQPAE
ncbi:MAG TPA: 3-hydroxyacyl-CoA dehydrogenase NAD-binding domain-containing protein [Aquamicrobium sp.]|nr:3-hydroxyacyl-CoA dehydrogenase NAD-binding domain-containing protein [Aquamicrobium sp.]